MEGRCNGLQSAAGLQCDAITLEQRKRESTGICMSGRAHARARALLSATAWTRGRTSLEHKSSDVQALRVPEAADALLHL
jgi:hypothetical protein